MEEFDHLKIQLKDIISATHNFVPDKRIGDGGFGSVYKGELSRPEGLVTVACKRLDPQFGQGHVEFLKEIVMLSKYKHENLVSLLHFCIEGDERILVYKYASRGSLDRYLNDPSLTWTQRLKICVGVARALNYLHDPSGNQRILHRDIKSSNILLDEDWNAKVSDFGLSKFGPANHPRTYVISNAVGTPGYCDPMYVETGILSKESDVYSFGVVLFEVMCGTLCYEYRDGVIHDILVPMWKKCVEERRLNNIICHDLKEYMDPGSLNTFSTIAYRCLERAHNERPTMAVIVQQLEIALEQQDLSEDIDKRMNFEEMRRMADLAVCPLSYVSQRQLRVLLMKGMLVDDGKTWFSVNKEGQNRELVSVSKCVSTDDVTLFIIPDADLVSRFQYLFKYRVCSTQDLRLRVTTQFLSPNVTYIINLVYRRNQYEQTKLIPFKYKMEEMSEYSTAYVVHASKDGLLRTELFQFTSTKKKHYFDIHFRGEVTRWDDSSDGFLFSIFIEGVEFCHVDLGKEKIKVDLQSIPYSDTDWKRKLPHDYIQMLKLSNDVEKSTSRKEVYFRLREGIYINNSQQWFSISKNSKKRLMLPARAIIPEKSWILKHLTRRKVWVWRTQLGSRFKEVAESFDNKFINISFEVEPELLSPITDYACYLVFKLPENASAFENVVRTRFWEVTWGDSIPIERYMYLVTPPHTPIIEVSPGEGPSRTRKIKGHPKLRKDGWMEIQVGNFRTTPSEGPSAKSYRVKGYLASLNEWKLTGLLVQGIELRPAKISI